MYLLSVALLASAALAVPLNPAQTSANIPSEWGDFNFGMTTRQTTATSSTTSKSTSYTTKATTSVSTSSKNWHDWPVKNSTSRTSTSTKSSGTGRVGNWASWSSPDPNSPSNSNLDNAPGWSDWTQAGNGADGPVVYNDDIPAPSFLKPAIHWDIDTYSLGLVAPQAIGKGAPLFFADSEDYTKPFMGAFANFNFNGPTINIDHSAYMTATCDGAGTISVKFGSKAAYNQAVSSWLEESGMIIVGLIQGCGNYANNELCYFKVSGLSFDESTMTCSVQGTDSNVHDTITDYEFTWNQFSPVGTKSGSGGSSSGTSKGWGPTTTFTSSTRTSYGSGPTTTSISGSSTDNSTLQDLTTSNQTTCVAPKDTKYGLPTACLGYGFDNDLDKAYGFEDWDSTGIRNSLQYMANQLTNDDNLGDTGSEDLASTNLAGKHRKRQLLNNIGNGIKSGFKTMVNSGQTVAKAVKAPVQTLKQVTGSAVNGIKTVANNIPLITKPVDYTSSQSTTNFKFPSDKYKYEKHPIFKNAIKIFDYTPDEKTLKASKKNKKTVWKGKEVEVERNITAEARLRGYCVDCSFSGTVVHVGYVKGAIATGFTAAGVDFTANMRTRVALGLAGELEITLAKKSLSLISATGKFMLPGLITVGPYITLKVEAIPKVTIAGTMEAGAELRWKSARGRIGFNDNKPHTASGWTPEWTPIFNLTGEVGVALEVGLPLDLNFGISIFNDKYEMKLSIQERPALEAKASIGGSIGLQQGTDGKSALKAEFGLNQCKGIKTGINFKNTVGFKYQLGSMSKPIGNKNLHEYEKDIYEGCIPLVGDDKKQSTTRRSLGRLTPAHYKKRDAHYDDYYTVVDLTTANTTTNTTDLQPSDWTLTESDVIDMMNSTTNVTYYEGTTDLGPIAIVPYNTTDGWEFTTLVDPTQTVMVVSCSNGNLFVQQYDTAMSNLLIESGCGALWEYENNQTNSQVVVADGAGKMLHYIPDEMALTGVARLRTSDMYEFPVDMALIVFAQRTEVSNQFIPVDFANDIGYGLVTCTYNDQPAKLFIVDDYEKGISVLKSADVKFSITGGDVVDCYALPLVSGSHKPDDAWNGEGAALPFDDDWMNSYVWPDFGWTYSDDD